MHLLFDRAQLGLCIAGVLYLKSFSSWVMLRSCVEFQVEAVVIISNRTWQYTMTECMLKGLF